MNCIVTPCPIAQLESELLKLYKSPMRKPATLKGMRQAFRELRALPDLYSTTDLHPGLIADWIGSWPGRSSQRTLALLRNIRVICNYAVERHWLEVSPFKIRPLRSWMRPDAVPSRNTGKVYRRSQNDIRGLLRLLDDEASGSWRARRLQALVYVYVYTAFRKMEALHLLAANCDFAEMTIKIEPLPPVWTPKTVPSARTVPMAPALVAVLRPWVQMCAAETTKKKTGHGWLFPGSKLRGPWTGGSPGYNAYTEVIAAGERAGLGHITPIYARKWFGTGAKAMGLGKLEVQGFLGHASPDTQAAYDEEAIESMRPAVRKLELFYGAAQ